MEQRRVCNVPQINTWNKHKCHYYVMFSSFFCALWRFGWSCNHIVSVRPPPPQWLMENRATSCLSRYNPNIETSQLASTKLSLDSLSLKNKNKRQQAEIHSVNGRDTSQKSDCNDFTHLQNRRNLQWETNTKTVTPKMNKSKHVSKKKGQ